MSSCSSIFLVCSFFPLKKKICCQFNFFSYQSSSPVIIVLWLFCSSFITFPIFLYHSLMTSLFLTFPWGQHCQRTPQSTSHYSRLLRQSPIHPSTQMTKPPPAARDLTVVWPTCLTYVSNLRVQPTCPTYMSNLHVRPTWLAYISTLRVQLSDHIIILIIYLR